MLLEKLKPFLDANGWHEIAVKPSTCKGHPDSTFHQFTRMKGESDLTLLIADQGGGNGIVVWVDTQTEANLETTAQIKDVRDLVRRHNPA